MKFAIVMQQRGGGCDHTIACGTKLVPLEADDRGAALAEARRYLVGEDGDRPVYQTGQDNDYDGALEHAYLVRVEDELPVDEIVAELRAADIARARARAIEVERLQYELRGPVTLAAVDLARAAERLHRKFGGGT